MRRPIVAGNWKMHGTLAEAEALASGVRDRVAGSDAVEIVLCPPFTALQRVGQTVAGSPIALGAQHLHWEHHGAFTGEVSAGMLRDLGCRYVIIGHSERRSYFGETDETVARRVVAALEAGLRPIVCVGETLEQREAGRTEEVVRVQVERGLGRLGPRLAELVVAYEPVWAIGTGKTATAEQAQAAHAFLRSVLASLAGEEAAAAVRIQYGGSVKPSNAAELFALGDVDGGLIGGASLEAESFGAIVRAAGSDSAH
jgi:triosephosphate isomerase